MIGADDDDDNNEFVDDVDGVGVCKRWRIGDG